MKTSAHNCTPAVAEVARYRESTEVVDWQDPAVLARAREVTASLESEFDRVRALFEWVRGRVPHSYDANRMEVTCSASDVLRVGTGICYAKAHLLVAMLRAVVVPAGFCYQVCEHESPWHRPVLHGLVAAYLEERGRWVHLDARGNGPGVDAQCLAEGEQLAFSELPFFDEYVHPEPFPSVVRVLQTCRNRLELWSALPGGRE